MSARTRVLCINLDSADKDLIAMWAAAGELPAFRRLLERGASGAVVNPRGLFVGGLWASYNTGVLPGRHGHHWFQQLRPGTYELHRTRPTDIAVEPFWCALSRANRRVAIIDVPETFPTPGLNGIQLTDWGTHTPSPTGFCTWPPTLAREITARFGRDPVGLCDRRHGDGDTLRSFRDDVLRRVRRKTELTGYLLDQGGWDLFVAGFGDLHCAGHHLWHVHDPAHPRHSAELVQALGDPLKDVYVSVDGGLGELLAHVGDDTTVIVLCSHGMGPLCGGNFLLDDVLRRFEGLPPSRRRWRLRDGPLWCWQRTPRAVRSRLEPVRREVVRWIDRRPVRLDGSRSCFALPHSDGTGAIRINLAGRDPNGQVQPGAEYEALCEQVRRDLTALINVDTGNPAVRSVCRVDDLYSGPMRHHLPDLLVEWDRRAPIRALESPKTGRVEGVDPQHRTGDHKPGGQFFVLGPRSAPGMILPAVSIVDFAPTIAALLGVMLPDVEGRPIGALVEAAPATHLTRNEELAAQ